MLWVHYYPVDSAVCYFDTYPLDSNLSGGWCYSPLEQLGPDLQGAPCISETAPVYILTSFLSRYTTNSSLFFSSFENCQNCCN